MNEDEFTVRQKLLMIASGAAGCFILQLFFARNVGFFLTLSCASFSVVAYFTRRMRFEIWYWVFLSVLFGAQIAAILNVRLPEAEVGALYIPVAMAESVALVWIIEKFEAFLDKSSRIESS